MPLTDPLSAIGSPPLAFPDRITTCESSAGMAERPPGPDRFRHHLHHGCFPRVPGIPCRAASASSRLPLPAGPPRRNRSSTPTSPSSSLPEPLRPPARTLHPLPPRYRANLSRSPPFGNEFSNDYLTSYRAKNGVLHNPQATTAARRKGTFHVTEGGLPIPGDKKPRGAEIGLRRALPGRHEPRRATCSALPFYREPASRRPKRLRLASAASHRLPRSARGVCARKADGNPLLRPGRICLQSRFRRIDLRQCRRSVRSDERCRPRCRTLDRPHRLRHPRAPPHTAFEENPRPAALRRCQRDSCTAARRACAGKSRNREVQRWRPLQAHSAAPKRPRSSR